MNKGLKGRQCYRPYQTSCISPKWIPTKRWRKSKNVQAHAIEKWIKSNVAPIQLIVQHRAIWHIRMAIKRRAKKQLNIDDSTVWILDTYNKWNKKNAFLSCFSQAKQPKSETVIRMPAIWSCSEWKIQRQNWVTDKEIIIMKDFTLVEEKKRTKKMRKKTKR